MQWCHEPDGWVLHSPEKKNPSQMELCEVQLAEIRFALQSPGKKKQTNKQTDENKTKQQQQKP